MLPLTHYTFVLSDHAKIQKISEQFLMNPKKLRLRRRQRPRTQSPRDAGLGPPNDRGPGAEQKMKRNALRG